MTTAQQGPGPRDDVPDESELLMRAFGGTDVPHLPLAAIWLSAEGVARMIGYKVRQVRERIALGDDFPRPSTHGGSHNPRWNAAEVQRWMKRGQRAAQKRPKTKR